MNRRGFLGAMLAACAAPAVVKASNIMRIASDRGLWVPDFVEYPGLSITDFDARVMGPINRALAEHVDDALCEEIAADLLRTGQVGVVDRFTVYESPNEYVAGMVDGRNYTRIYTREAMTVFEESSEIPEHIWNEGLVWKRHGDSPFWGRGVPELAQPDQRQINADALADLKDYSEPVGPANSRVIIGAKFDPRVPPTWNRPGKRD